MFDHGDHDPAALAIHQHCQHPQQLICNWHWKKGRSREETEASLRKVFEADPALMDTFLDTYTQEGWEVESGLPVSADLRQQNHKNNASVILATMNLKVSVLAMVLKMDEPEYCLDGEPERLTVHQFA